MEDQAEKGLLSRRDFLRLTGAAGGAVVGAGAALAVKDVVDHPLSEQDRQFFIESVRDLKTEDLDNPEGKKFQNFFFCCAREYSRVMGLPPPDKDPRYLKATRFFTSSEKYLDFVKQYEPDYTNTEAWGRAFRDHGVTALNLETIKSEAIDKTPYPGLLLMGVLAHEWGHLFVKKNYEGNQLKSPHNGISTKKHGIERYDHYDGSEIRTKNGYSLVYFDEAVVEHLSQQAVYTAIKGDVDLNLSASVVHEDMYFPYAQRLSKVVLLAGISTEELFQMHLTSDVENLLGRLGSLFDDRALEEVSEAVRGNRSPEEMTKDRDFLVGKKLAFAINFKEWDVVQRLYGYLKKN